MAVYNGTTTTAPSVAFGGKSSAPRNGVTLDPAGGTVTYCYREAAQGDRSVGGVRLIVLDEQGVQHGSP